jgi:CBS domain-containing protein
MRNLHIHRLLVLEDGRLAGILSALDLLKVLERPQEFEEFYRLFRT